MPQGRNVFAAEDPHGQRPMQHAAAGLLATMADGMAIFAPLANSWRRFRPEAYVPLTADWSVNNRGTALRVPVSDAANRRLEHRVAGAEANPYLVMSWILGGILKGLDEAALPPRAADGQRLHRCDNPAGRRCRATGPLRWTSSSAAPLPASCSASDCSSSSPCVKRGELDEFNSHVTPQECARVSARAMTELDQAAVVLDGSCPSPLHCRRSTGTRIATSRWSGAGIAGLSAALHLAGARLSRDGARSRADRLGSLRPQWRAGPVRSRGGTGQTQGARRRKRMRDASGTCLSRRWSSCAH